MTSSQLLWKRITVFLVYAGFSIYFTLSHSEPQGESFLNAMIDYYQAVDSYTDEGSVSVSVHHSGKLVFEQAARFRTSYTKQNRFEFEYSEKEFGNNRTIRKIESDESRTIVRFGDEIAIEKDSMESALFMLAGITNGSSLLVPSLLLKDVSRSWEAEPQDYRLIGVDTVNGKEVRVVKAETNGGSQTLWIGVAPPILLKYQGVNTRFERIYRTTIVYNVRR